MLAAARVLGQEAVDRREEAERRVRALEDDLARAREQHAAATDDVAKTRKEREAARKAHEAARRQAGRARARLGRLENTGLRVVRDPDDEPDRLRT